MSERKFRGGAEKPRPTSVAAAFGIVLIVAASARAQTPPQASTADAAVGIPVQSDLVRAKCGGCHRTDDKGRMSRISYRRATPENWERTIKRMVTLNHATLEPVDARGILKYLSDHLGLAPEEARPIAFDAERRMIEYSYTADKDTSDLCSSCHSFARVLSERRTKEEWDLLVAMHRGYYPLVDNQPMNNGPGFRRGGRGQTEPAPDGRPPDNRHPMEKALDHLTKTLPLVTSEWSAWSAAMQPPKLAGRWAIVGTLPGKGAVFGQVTIAADAGGADSFVTQTRYTVARTGETVTRTGRALVYTGYQWRGRSNAEGANADPWREVLFVERDWKQMWGRWFTGAYDETGVDVKLLRLSNDPVVFGTSVSAIKTASTARPVKIFGANLPTDVKADDIGLGQGVKVARIVNARADEIALEVDVAPTAPIGARDVSVGGTVKTSALVVFDKIDGLRVLPQAGMARVGGNVFPKQLQQFEAVGLNNGPDGKPDTADDLNLGIVEVKWSVEEYPATWDDDDIKWVGTLDANGLFTPNVDGPNPKRAGNRNNVGDVWIVAEATSTDARDATKPLRARAHLLVTVPLYMAWFQGGGSQ
ncbi:MAG TPA: quinohemoprotein amine dehydrogenase subunit alpha [Vicinamibacterales bacterium]|nr:quinohemoprotein amine dehydrogenase subunit alpha [Vicinamibacterales bacterium]